MEIPPVGESVEHSSSHPSLRRRHRASADSVDELLRFLQVHTSGLAKPRDRQNSLATIERLLDIPRTILKRIEHDAGVLQQRIDLDIEPREAFSRRSTDDSFMNNIATAMPITAPANTASFIPAMASDSVCALPDPHNR